MIKFRKGDRVEHKYYAFGIGVVSSVQEDKVALVIWANDSTETVCDCSKLVLFARPVWAGDKLEKKWIDYATVNDTMNAETYKNTGWSHVGGIPIHIPPKVSIKDSVRAMIESYEKATGNHPKGIVLADYEFDILLSELTPAMYPSVTSAIVGDNRRLITIDGVRIETMQ
jgi:hypothetical protein